MAEELKDVTDSIELVPVSGLNVNFQLKPAEITVEGKEVLEQALAAYQKKYAGYVVTEKTLKDDKDVKNELGRVQRQIDQNIKDQLSDYSKPLDEVKKWKDEILTPISNLQKDIKSQIDEFEQKATEARKQTIKEAFETAISENGTALDINEFSQHFDTLAPKKNFMADNKRLSKDTLELINGLVQVQAAKQEEYDNALMQISETAAKAGFGPALYVKRFKQGASLPDILRAILDDKELADKANAEAKARKELDKRIGEMVAIATQHGLDPQKYTQLLESGRSALEVHQILTQDAKEREEQVQNQSSTQKQPEFEPKTVSEGDYTSEPKQAENGRNMVSGDAPKKYGYKFTVDLIFPAKNAKEVKDEFKQWLDVHGVKYIPKSKSVRVEM